MSNPLKKLKLIRPITLFKEQKIRRKEEKGDVAEISLYISISLIYFMSENTKSKESLK